VVGRLLGLRRILITSGPLLMVFSQLSMYATLLGFEQVAVTVQV
jgi:hypothetical protein